VYGSGGFTSYSHQQLRDQLGGWAAQGIRMVKMKVGRDPEKDPERVRVAREAMESLKKKKNAPQMALYTEPEKMSKVWEVRESGLGATAFVPGERDTWPGWEDSAVPPEKVGDYLRDLRFAPQTFRERFAEKPASRGSKPDVMLFPDTFNNHFYPETAKAAVAVLEAAGYHVQIPKASLCCGRPLYDYGMLDTAKRLLQKTMRHLEPHLSAGTPIVVLEPSCASVFRDELPNLFPHHQDARRRSQQTFLLNEFLEKKGPDFKPPALNRKALVHGHCHQKAVMGMEHEESMLKKMGLELVMPDSGCCGIAGSFGYEEGDRYQVSVRAGERVLLPAVRQAGDDTLIIADGFSCREQIRQGTKREALHSAQALEIALQQGAVPAIRHNPETVFIQRREREHAEARRELIAAMIAASTMAALFWMQGRQRRH